MSRKGSITELVYDDDEGGYEHQELEDEGNEVCELRELKYGGNEVYKHRVLVYNNDEVRELKELECMFNKWGHEPHELRNNDSRTSKHGRPNHGNMNAYTHPSLPAAHFLSWIYCSMY
jgi:hypothetical protein